MVASESTTSSQGVESFSASVSSQLRGDQFLGDRRDDLAAINGLPQVQASPFDLQIEDARRRMNATIVKNK